MLRSFISDWVKLAQQGPKKIRLHISLETDALDFYVIYLDGFVQHLIA